MSDRILHRMAQAAFDSVSKVASKSEKDRSEYKSFCEGLPALLRTAGLLQTVAFMEAKSKPPHSIVLEDLGAQLRSLGLWDGGGNLAARISKLPSSEYMTWTRLVDRMAYWLKRFAQALLRTQSDNA